MLKEDFGYFDPTFPNYGSILTKLSHEVFPVLGGDLGGEVVGDPGFEIVKGIEESG
jgi:hypothetical protein